MKVLFICDERPHPHDYGTDFLVQGAYALLGAEHVFEWPEKPNLHLAPYQSRDGCRIDSDAWLPCKQLPAATLAAMAEAGEFAAVILTGSYGTEGAWRAVCGALAPATPVIGLHYDDEAHDTQPLLEQIARRPLHAYYHREQPPAGARQLWLTQPQSRVRPVAHKPNLRRVFFNGTRHAHDHDDPRVRMAASVMAAMPDAEMRVTSDQTNGRLAPEVYRERLWESAISLVWTSAPGFNVWQSNRFVESLALGCAVIAERPIGAVPEIDGVRWIDRPEDAGAACAEILAHDSPISLRERQRRAQQSFCDRYTSEVVLSEMLAEVA